MRIYTALSIGSSEPELRKKLKESQKMNKKEKILLRLAILENLNIPKRK